MAGKVIKIGDAIHDAVERALKGVPVQKQRGAAVTAAALEAKRLRAEQVARERQKFGTKKGIAPTDKDPWHMLDTGATDDYDGAQNPSAVEQMNQLGSSLSGMSISEELMIDRVHGRMRPFVEGEPLGVCHNEPKPGPASTLKTRDELMDEKQTALCERQKRNDATLARLKEKYQ